MSIDERRLQETIDSLRGNSGRFYSAAQDILSRAQYLFGISIDITYSASNWMSAGSQAFQDAWNQYDFHSHRAIAALNHTGDSLNNLANRLEEVLQEKQALEQRANALLLATAGLSLLDVLQLGLDPATDAATAGTLAASAFLAAQSFDLDGLVSQADSASGNDITGAETSNVGSLTMIDQGAIEFTGSGAHEVWSYTPGNTGDSGQTDTTESSVGNTSLYVGAGGSVWSYQSPDHEIASADGVPITETHKVGIDNGSIGVGVHQGADGTTDIGLMGSFSVFQASEDATFGSNDLGLTGGVQAEADAVDGTLGVKDDSLDADVGATLVSATGSVGANIGGVNASVNATIGIKAELGFSIGAHTEIKLPFISFGFSIG
ncbi:MAG TPA: hypothetical protein VNE61_14605 [Ktedonobacteraceae bacterium]|nr:hypothetical protein [Ktedonobacteraceae bacterium]